MRSASVSWLDSVLCHQGGLKTFRPRNELWWLLALTLFLAPLLEPAGSFLLSRGLPCGPGTQMPGRVCVSRKPSPSAWQRGQDLVI